MYFSKNDQMILMISKVQDNKVHCHYAIQFTVAISQPITMITDQQHSQLPYSVNSVMQPHSLATVDEVLILLINPSSKIGYWLSRQKNENLLEIISQRIRVQAVACLTHNSSPIALLANISLIFEALIIEQASITDSMEPRILQAMKFLQSASPQITSLDTIANQVSLSPSRFLHLFKQEMGISYRRFQLWLRLLSSIDLLTQSHSITLVAHDSGFSDSAHYSRTFKECFGYTPNEFRKMKRLYN